MLSQFINDWQFTEAKAFKTSHLLGGDDTSSHPYRVSSRSIGAPISWALVFAIKNRKHESCQATPFPRWSNLTGKKRLRRVLCNGEFLKPACAYPVQKKSTFTVDTYPQDNLAPNIKSNNDTPY